MSTGQGSIIRTNRNIPAGVPPFPANSARNGLSVDATGFIVLGQDVGAVGDPAALLNNREIPLAGFLLEATNAGNRKFVLDSANDVYILGDIDAQTHGTFFEIDNLGDVIINNALQSFVTILPPFTGGVITIQMNSGTPGGVGINLDGINGDIVQGDLFGGGNFMQSVLDDTNQVAAIGKDPINTQPGLWLDFANSDYALGDFFVAANGNYIEVDDGSNNIDVFSAGRVRIAMANSLNNGIKLNDPAGSHTMKFIDASARYLFLDPTNSGGGGRLFKVGDIDAANNGSFIEVNDSTQLFRFQANGKQWINADNVNKQATIGDINASGQGTKLQVADGVGAGVIAISNTALNAIVQINGNNGFTGTKTPPASITVVGGIVTNVT